MSISPLRLLLLSIGGSVVIATGAIIAIQELWQPAPLESMLPAGGTRAIFSNVTREDVRAFSGMFPELKTVPDFTSRLNVGVLDEGWILTSPDKNFPLPEVNGTFRRQDILMSDAAVLEIMMQEAPRVKTADAFRMIARGMSDTTPRVYLSSAAQSLPETLRPFLRASGSVIVGWRGPLLIFRGYGQPTIQPPALMRRPMALSPAPDMSIAAARPAEMMDTILSALPESELAARQNDMRVVMATMFGGDWSFKYDVLPLIEGESAVHLSLDDSPSLLFHGGMQNPNETREFLASLHDRFRDTLLGTTVTRRTLQGFTSTVIRSDPSQVSERRYALNGWTVHETREINGSGALVSATRGRQFLFSTHPQWADQMIARTQEQRPVSILSSATAAGIASSEVLAQLTGDRANDPLWAWMKQALGDPSANPMWSVEIDGHSLTLSLTLPQP